MMCVIFQFQQTSAFFVSDINFSHAPTSTPVKIVRLPNISMYKYTIDVIFNEMKIDIDLVLYRVLKLNLFMVVVSHWVGCLWFMIGSLSKEVGYSDNWLDADESDPSLSISHSDYGGFSAYLRSVYWAVVG